jgi:hypothetical protein
MSRFTSLLAIAVTAAFLIVAAAALTPVTAPATAKTAIALPSSGPNAGVVVGIMGARDRGVRIALPSSGPSAGVRAGIIGGPERSGPIHAAGRS